MLAPLRNTFKVGVSICALALLIDSPFAIAEEIALETIETVETELEIPKIEDTSDAFSASEAPPKNLKQIDKGSDASGSSNVQLQNLEEVAGNSMLQVTSVSELADVQPADWAFEALQSLVERYGCIAGYPDGTYRGDRALTRYEFAAGLNACLERINQLIAAGTADQVTRDDLITLQRLQTEFEAESSVLSRRLDQVEASLAAIEENQFSTTTVLNGEILFAASAVGGGEVNGREVNSNVVFSDRVELNLSTSFFGNDLLRARLAAANTPNFAETTGTNFSKLSFTGDNENDVVLGALFYRFALTDRAVALIGAQGIGFGDFAPTLNPYINNSLLGTVSNFGGEAPIFAFNGGRGVGIEYRFSRAVRLSVGYLSATTTEPEFGFSKGPYGAIAQLTVFPSPSLSLALTYVNAYNLPTGKGSQNADNPFDGAATSIDAYGLQASYQVTPNFNISGWAGLFNAHAEAGPYKGSDATVSTWALTFAFPDLGGLGNLAGIVIGQPPKAIENDVIGREDPDTSLHLEAFYRYQINDNIAITPGFFIVTNPEHNSDNDLIYVGTVRTSFVF